MVSDEARDAAVDAFKRIWNAGGSTSYSMHHAIEAADAIRAKEAQAEQPAGGAVDALKVLTAHQEWRMGAEVQPTDPRKLTAAITAAIAALQQPVTPRLFYVIEFAHQGHPALGEWWRGCREDEDTSSAWTRDIHKAIKYADRASAERAYELLGWCAAGSPNGHVITEHAWVAHGIPVIGSEKPTHD